MNVAYDHEHDEIVLRVKRGGGAGGFATFLAVAADALEHGKLIGNAAGNPTRAADELRKLAIKIHGHNNA